MCVVIVLFLKYFIIIRLSLLFGVLFVVVVVLLALNDVCFKRANSIEQRRRH